MSLADTTGNIIIDNSSVEDSLHLTESGDPNGINLLQRLTVDSHPKEDVYSNEQGLDESWRMTNDAILKTLYGDIPNLTHQN